VLLVLKLFHTLTCLELLIAINESIDACYNDAALKEEPLLNQQLKDAVTVIISAFISIPSSIIGIMIQIGILRI
jgi:hypothetical protein